jgi:hypothetical protein
MIEFSTYGGCSSMAEHRTVDADVEGSSPFSHPPIKDDSYGAIFFIFNYRVILDGRSTTI